MAGGEASTETDNCLMQNVLETATGGALIRTTLSSTQSVTARVCPCLFFFVCVWYINHCCVL